MKRRDFIKSAALFFGSVGLFSEALGKLPAKCPQGVPKDAKALKKMLKVPSSTAKRLHFVANWKDAEKHKKFKAGSNCGNCKFYNLKKEADFYAPCTMAGNKYVPACGWCKSYKIDKKKS